MNTTYPKIRCCTWSARLQCGARTRMSKARMLSSKLKRPVCIWSRTAKHKMKHKRLLRARSYSRDIFAARAKKAASREIDARFIYSSSACIQLQCFRSQSRFCWEFGSRSVTHFAKWTFHANRNARELRCILFSNLIYCRRSSSSICRQKPHTESAKFPAERVSARHRRCVETAFARMPRMSDR